MDEYQHFPLPSVKNSHGIQPPLPILQLPRHLKLVLGVLHFNPTAMKTHASQSLESDVNETLMVDWSS
jgi:hypothetical protein